MQDHMACRESVSNEDRENHQADGEKAPNRAEPKVAPEGLPNRQTVACPCASFDTRQNNRRDHGREKISDLLEHFRPQTAVAQISQPCELNGESLQCQESYNIKGKTPAGT